MEFTSIGFDIRLSPFQSYPSADYSEWEKEEEAFFFIKNNLDISQNEYSLLDITDQETLNIVIDYVNKKFINCDLIEIKMPYIIVKSRKLKFGINSNLTNLDISCFSCCGFDICDINGLYTCFNHPEIIKIRKKYKYITKLIPKENIELALELAQYANYFDQPHRPFVVTKVFSLKHKLETEKIQK